MLEVNSVSIFFGSFSLFFLLLLTAAASASVPVLLKAVQKSIPDTLLLFREERAVLQPVGRVIRVVTMIKGRDAELGTVTSLSVQQTQSSCRCRIGANVMDSTDYAFIVVMIVITTVTINSVCACVRLCVYVCVYVCVCM